MKLPVTGGAGYIGSVVTYQFLREVHEVTVLDSLPKGHETAVPEGTRFVKDDLLDPEGVRDALAERFDGVLHVAVEAGEHCVYNLGNGAGFSVREVIEATRGATGRPVRTLKPLRRAGDPALLVASTHPNGYD